MSKKPARTELCVMTLAIGLLGLVPPTASAQNGNQIIALTGNASPDGNGTFNTFSNPMLNNAGQIAFGADLVNTLGATNDDLGIFRADGTTISQVAREFFIPISGTTLTDLSVPHGINNAGQIVYTATVDSNFIDATGQIRVGSPGSTTIIAADGTRAPDGSGGTNGELTFLVSSSPTINNSGEVAFANTLVNTTGGTGRSALFRGAGGPLTQILREDQDAPDNDGTIALFSTNFSPAFNNAGDVSIAVELDNTNHDEAVFRGSGGPLTQLARAGQTAPDGNGVYDLFSPVALNDAGQTVIRARLQETIDGTDLRMGLFLAEENVTTQIVRFGQLAPDGNGRFLSPNLPALNAIGQVAFNADLSDTAGGPGVGSDNSGIFRGSGGAITQIAREGELVGGTNLTFIEFNIPTLNRLGQTAFLAFVDGPDITDASNDQGLFIGDGIDTALIVREGDSLAGDTIDTIALNSSINFGLPNRGGDTRSGINDNGQVAYSVSLSDGREAIVLWTPPDAHWSAGSGPWNTASNWQQGITPKSLYDVFLDPVDGATITGNFGNEHVKSLTVGNNTGALVVLNLSNGDLTSLQTARIRANGRINLGGQRVLNASVLTNEGILSGDGQINAEFENTSTGEVRVVGGEHLVFTGANRRNEGTIDVNGQDGLATIEFDQPLTNEVDTGVILSRGRTVLRFDGGLANEGGIGIAFSDATLFGNITNDGEIIVTGNSNALFADDVVNNIILHVEEGSTAVFFGDYQGRGASGTGDVTMHGDLRPGFSPGQVDFGGSLAFGPAASLEIELQAPGTTAGDDYDQVNVTGEVSLDGQLDLLLLDGFVPDFGDVFPVLTAGQRSGEFDRINGVLPEGADFALAPIYDFDGSTGLSIVTALPGDADLNGTVALGDLGILLDNLGSAGGWSEANFNGDGAVALGDLGTILDNLGRSITSAAAAPAIAAVPEPSTLLLTLVSMMGLLRRRVARCP